MLHDAARSKVKSAMSCRAGSEEIDDLQDTVTHLGRVCEDLVGRLVYECSCTLDQRHSNPQYVHQKLVFYEVSELLEDLLQIPTVVPQLYPTV